MKDDDLIVSISNVEDLKKITDNTRYINIDITSFNQKMAAFFTEYGQSFKYSDIIDGVYGYTYVNYEEFIKAENIIDEICNNMPKDLNELEKARYLYISLAKCISFDINCDTNKCEIYDLSLITNTNNIWGSLAIGSVTNISASKIYYYLCMKNGLKANITIDDHNICFVKLMINNQMLVTNIFMDIPFINALMKTRYFGTYNDDVNLDRKINYIKDEYNDDKLDKVLKDIDYTKHDFVGNILDKTQLILDIDKIKPMELNNIFKYIFDKYAANYEVKINNLFLNDNKKLHFIVISGCNIHYSYNYKKNSFVIITDDDIIDNLSNGKIGLYLDEIVPNINYVSHLLN